MNKLTLNPNYMFKKIFSFMLVIMASLMIFSCNKVNTDTEKLVNVVFNYRLVESNSMYATKAMANEAILLDIQSCLPEYISLVIQGTNQTTGTYTVKSGEETQIPVGTYRVSGAFYSGQVGDLINTNCYFTSQPYISINTNITIVEGTTNYSVPATFNSFAFVIDYDEVKTAQYRDISYLLKNVPFQRFDNIGLVFCQGSYKDIPLQMVITPLDETKYRETDFGFSTNSTTQRYTYVEPGKFYKLHPWAVEASGPIVGLNIPNFEEGVVNNN